MSKEVKLVRIELNIKVLKDNKYQKSLSVLPIQRHDEEENKKYETKKMFQGYTINENQKQANRRIYIEYLNSIEERNLTDILKCKVGDTFTYLYSYVLLEEDIETIKKLMWDKLNTELANLIISIKQLQE